jgi:hypothetical protein
MKIADVYRCIYKLVLSLLVASSLVAVPVYAATSDPVPITGIGGKCLDVRGGKAKNGNKVQIYDCNSTNAQKWSQPGDGTIRNQDYCLDVARGHLASKTPVQIYKCNGSSAQQWTVNSDGLITNPKSGLCLDDVRGIVKNGNGIWLYKCNSSSAQKWTVTQSAPSPVLGTESAQPAQQTPTPTPAPAVVTPAPAPAAPANCPNGTYVNSAGSTVCSPYANNSAPSGATAKCGDGTYSFSQIRRGTCSGHGGVAEWL